ncbi:MAG: ATP-dependent DNA helicase UvrD2 [Nocardioides sp.]|uniref:ATP-dependent DNA helicase UvrD2 n=1 Tax=Nocardioides sp. TaxID=35761 RepID=UPI003F00F596
MPTPADLLAGLDDEQRRVAEALRGPVRVLAGAGTGKTRAITHRIAHGVAAGVYAPTEVLAVTFTTRAAGEMRHRLRDLGAGGVQARTFHSAALRQLRYFWPRAYGRELPELIESKFSLLALAARRQRIQADQALLRDLAGEVEWAKVSNVQPADYPRVAAARDRSVASLAPEEVARVLDGYEEVKRQQGRMDMEDVLLFTAGMLADNEAVAAQVRRQYKWFVVDEFQDVSPLQSALLDLWLGGRDEICVVGDPAQTIYSFAGADATYLRRFTDKFPGATSVELVRNYRCTPQVVQVANDLLAGTPSKGVDLVAQRPSGEPVRWSREHDEESEAEDVAERIKLLLADGTPASQVAVLFRVNAQSERFEEALSSRSIPYVVRGAARFFDRPEVRQAVTLLRGSARVGVTDGSLTEQVGAVLAGMGWTAEMPTARGEVRNRWESLQALVDQAAEFAENGAGDLVSFVADLERRAAEQHAPVAEGVTLATLHAAKGLEWDAVFLAGMHDQMMPISHAKDAAAIEEERRLLYVGVTRARDRLHVSWAASRSSGGSGRRQPSRFFVRQAEQAGASAPRTSSRTERRNRKALHCKVCGGSLSTAAEKKTGRCSSCPAAYDETVFEALKTWRLERSREDSVPAFVVFTDATLELIAEVLPGDLTALRKISGVGSSKLEKYGQDVLDLVAAEKSSETTR